MAIFGFRTRNPARDRETDETRLHRLEHLLGELSSEIEREKNGLQSRYQKTADDAAFSLQALENDEGRAMSSRLDELTGSMARYSARIAELENQMEFFQKLRRNVAEFSKGKANLAN